MADHDDSQEAMGVVNSILSLVSCHQLAHEVDVSKTYEDAYVIVTYKHYGNNNHDYQVFLKEKSNNIKVFHRIRNNDTNETIVAVFKKGKWTEHLTEMLKGDVDDAAIFEEKRTFFQKIINGIKEIPFIFKKDKAIMEPPENTKSRVQQIE